METFVGKHSVVADGDAVTTKGEKGKKESGTKRNKEGEEATEIIS